LTLQSVPKTKAKVLRYNTDPVFTWDKMFDSLPELAASVLDGASETYFKASAGGVYLKDGLKPFLPVESDVRMSNPVNVPILPNADFVGLFAVGVRLTISASQRAFL
jgi:hypothetical protein